MIERIRYHQPKWANPFRIKRIYDLRLRRVDTIDHWYPNAGETHCGLHHEDNLVVMHQLLNMRKGNRDPEEWAREELEAQPYEINQDIYVCHLPDPDDKRMWITDELGALPLSQSIKVAA